MHLLVRQATRTDLPQVIRLCCPEVEGRPELKERVSAEWKALWDSLGMHGVAVEDLDSKADKVVGLMLAAHVSDSCVKQCITAREPYLLQNVASLIAAGRIKALGHDELAEANAGSGSNLLICYFGWLGQDHNKEPSATIRGLVVNAFCERHGGNRLKLLFGEIGGHLLDVASRYGTVILNDYRDWAAETGRLDEPGRPLIIGVNRDDGLAGGDFWLQRMFTYFPPRFLFTPSQREILLLAREGCTDVEIAEKLAVTTDAIKRRWVKIYARVQDVFPTLLPGSPEGSRGHEKRRALLNQLRDRPEEMRPYTRRGNRSAEG